MNYSTVGAYLFDAQSDDWGVIFLPAMDTSIYTSLETVTDEIVVRGGIYGVDEAYVEDFYATY